MGLQDKCIIQASVDQLSAGLISEFRIPAINTRPDHRSEAPRILQVVPVVGDIEENKNQKEQFGVYAQFGQSWSQRPDDDRSSVPLFILATNADRAPVLFL